MRFLLYPLVAPCLALLALLSGLATWALLPVSDVLELMAETGEVETATLALYLVVLLAVWLSRRQNPAPVWPALWLAIAGFLAREMDMHKYFTDISVLKISYYTGSAPLLHKAVALAAWTPPLLAASYLVARFAGPLWRGLRQGRATAVTAATFAACIVVSKLSDRSLGVLREDFGVSSSVAARALQVAIEEPVELVIPVLVLLGLLQQWGLRRR